MPIQKTINLHVLVVWAFPAASVTLLPLMMSPPKKAISLRRCLVVIIDENVVGEGQHHWW